MRTIVSSNGVITKKWTRETQEGMGHHERGQLFNNFIRKRWDLLNIPEHQWATWVVEGDGALVVRYLPITPVIANVC